MIIRPRLLSLYGRRASSGASPETPHKIEDLFLAWLEVECIFNESPTQPFGSAVRSLTGRPTDELKLDRHPTGGALHGIPFDGYAVDEALKQMAAMTGNIPKRAHLEKEYYGHKQARSHIRTAHTPTVVGLYLTAKGSHAHFCVKVEKPLGYQARDGSYES